jgi:hypothetical protein
MQSVGFSARTRQTVLLSLALFALNVAICGPLFRIEYLDDLQSNEGTFITFGRFVLDHWPHFSWFPWFNAGMPFENTYLPLMAFLVALVAFVVRCSPAHAFHFVAALAYSAGPVFLFLFARKVSGRAAPSFLAAVLWSLFSPSVMIPEILADTGTPWALRRLQNIIVYGETPHSVALTLLPLALLLLVRYWEAPGARRFAWAVLAVAATMLSNAFGIVVIGISTVLLVAARNQRRWRELVPAGAILLSAYLLICRFLPPSLINLIRTNSQSVGGDYRFTLKAWSLGVGFLLALALLWLVTRRLPGLMFRFAILFSACFVTIPVLAYWKHLSFLPQPQRYHLEMEVGICLLAAFVSDTILRRLPGRIAIAVVALCAIPLAWAGAQDCRYARQLIRPLAMTQSAPYQEARWIAAHLPAQRIMVSGEAGFWFNLFADNPQLSAGHEPFAPNWMQRVAVFTIYSGENAGDQDAAISIFWLKVYGCGAITVPGPGSRDPYHPIRNFRKFDGLLPLVWREDGDSIYKVPLRSTSLAHVIPISAVVTRRPYHGLDIDPVRGYVAALDEPNLPAATLAWANPDRGRISARIAAGQAISVQMTYDRGWRASSHGRRLRIVPDRLGMMVIEPDGTGDCVIDLEFSGGPERAGCFGVSLFTSAALLAMLVWPARWRFPIKSLSPAGRPN